MRKLILIILITSSVYSFAQENPVVEQQIENLTEVDESETEDDSYVQLLQHYVKNKLNLNRASETELKEFSFLTPLHISSLLNYRKLFGNLLSLD